VSSVFGSEDVRQAATRACALVSQQASRPEVDIEAVTEFDVKDDSSRPCLAEKAARAWEAYLRLNDSAVADLFAGQLQSTITCMRCRTQSHCFDPFLDLSVPIPRGSEARPSLTTRLRGRVQSAGDAVRCSLEDCLSSFTTEEALDEENLMSCETCKTKCPGSKRLQVFRYPRILVRILFEFFCWTFVADEVVAIGYPDQAVQAHRSEANH
jgi:ubiquitin C-terminal hydrolase